MADSKKSGLSIASLNLDTSGWKYHDDKSNDHLRIWETTDHDAVSLHFFNKAPDLPTVASVAEIREFYSRSLQGSPAKLVGCGVCEIAGKRAVYLILKVPQKPNGMMYQTAITLPFRDFSFVVKVQCNEQGMTGVREAILFDRRRKAGEKPNLSGGGPPFKDWNPDSSQYDNDFPQHPVSRVRRLSRHIIKTASLDPAIIDQPGFVLPN